MSDTEAAAQSEWTEDEAPRRIRGKRPRRPSFRYFSIRYSQLGGEYKTECHLCEWRSEYGSRSKSAKAAKQHVTDKHGVDGSEER